jgi:hypothetical protein
LTRLCPVPMVRPLGGARSSAVEHLTFNQRVDGSIPSGLTSFWGVSQSARDAMSKAPFVRRLVSMLGVSTGKIGSNALDYKIQTWNPVRD